MARKNIRIITKIEKQGEALGILSPSTNKAGDCALSRMHARNSEETMNSYLYRVFKKLNAVDMRTNKQSDMGAKKLEDGLVTPANMSHALLKE